MSYQEIENDIKSGAVDRAAPILLCGVENFLTSHYEKRLLARFSGSEKTAGNPDVSVLYMDEADDDAVMAALDTFPMLSPLRTVIVKSHPGLSGRSAAKDADADSGGKKKKDPLAEYIAQIPDTSRLVFVSFGVNKTLGLYKAISKHGTVYEFSRLDEAGLRNFTLKRFKAKGVNITPDVLDAFVFATGYLERDTDRDLFTVDNDAFKVASFVLDDGRDVITGADVEECMPDILRTGETVFEILDALCDGRKAKAVTLLENTLAGGENTFRLLSLFTGHFEIMLGCKELGAAGHSAASITKILGERSEWRVKKLGGYAQRFDKEKLQWIVGRLYDMDRNIKSGDIKERHALTVLIAEI